MSISILPSIVEFSMIAPTLNRHFIYNNRVDNITIDCSNGTLIIYKQGSLRYITLKLESVGITVTLYQGGGEKHIIHPSDNLPYVVKEPTIVLAGRVFTAKDGDERRTNVKQLIQWLETDDV